MRVMSMNACTDQLVLLLLPLERIASVTYLAERSAVTPQLAAKARGVRVNHGLAEEMLADRPDLVIAGRFTTPAARRMAQAAGAPLLIVDSADTFDAIRATTRQVAAAAGETERGEALLQRMDATLAALKASAPQRRVTAIAWDGSGRVPGRASLFNEILEAAGGVNLAARPGQFQSSLDLEQLLALTPQPQLLLYGSPDAAQPGLALEAVRHPVLEHAYAGRRLAVPEYACGTPEAANQALALRRQLQSAAAR